MAQTKVYNGYSYTQQADGTWKRGAPVAPQPPADPTFPYEGPKAAADATNAGATAQVNEATVPYQVRSAAAGATTAERGASTAGLPEGYMWNDAGTEAVPIPGYSRQGLSPEIRKGAIEAFQDARAIEQTVANLRKQFYAGPGQTRNLAGLQDYLPTGQNRVFSDTGNRARGQVKRALGFTGGEGNTATESEALYGPYLPQAGDKDEQIAAKIAALEELGQQAREKAITILGGVPDENGNVRPNAMTAIRTDGGRNSGVQAAEAGSDTKALPYPEAGQAEHDLMVGRLISEGGGRLDPQAYARERAALDAKYNMQGSPEEYIAWAGSINQYLGSGGRTVPTGIEPGQQAMTEAEQIRNSGVNNPLGAGFVGAIDGATGIPSALAPNQMGALSEAQFPSVLGGQVLGAVGATTGIGALGRMAAGRFAPQLLGGGSKAQFGRNLATDATYGAGYTGITEGDPLSGAAYGAVGSALGQPIGSALGRAVGGIPVPESVKALASRGIPMTTGQRLGGVAKSIEDKATSVPLVGDMINARRSEGIQAFNRTAFEDAGRTIGFQPQRIGKEGVQDMIGVPGDPKNVGAVGQAYDSATAGVSVPLDGQFYTDMNAVRGRIGNLPDDLAARADKALTNRVDPLTDTNLRRVGENKGWTNWQYRAADGAEIPIDTYPIHRSLEVSIDPENLANANRFGVADVRRGLSELKREFPEAESVFGRRISGAGPDRVQEISLSGVSPSTPSMTGGQFQQAMRGLKSYKAETTKPGFEEDYRGVLADAMSVLEAQMRRGGGADVVSGLDDANAAYRNAKILENATQRAKGGSGSGEAYMFTPSQLQMSVQQSQRRYPGSTPLESLADEGQRVLPSQIPDSGTAGRLANMAVPVGAVSAGGGAGYALNGGEGAQSGAMTGAFLTALALLGGTKGGQASINKVLFDRPEIAQRLGTGITHNKRLFGSAAVPMVIAAQ